MLRGRGVLGFLVFRFLVACFLFFVGFLVSWFHSMWVSRFLGILVSSFFLVLVPWFQSFLVFNISETFNVCWKILIPCYQISISCFFIDIVFIFKMFKMLSDGASGSSALKINPIVPSGQVKR